jgi:Subtilase family/Fibronectin type-III domain/PA domain
MSRRNSRRGVTRLVAAGAVVVAIAVPAAAQAAQAAPRDAGSFQATALQPDSTITAAKSTSGKRAVSDTTLIGRTDTTPVNVVVKLDYDATASYTGDVAGLAATSPSVTGIKLTGDSAPERAYEDYTTRLDRSFRSALARTIPSAHQGKSLQRVYGGVAVSVPANQISKLLAIPGVTAVQSDTMNKVDSVPVEGPTFIGAPTIWAQTGGQSLAGQGVIFADLDTGLWPEHPMLAADSALGTPPPTAGGTPRPCNFGDNPLTPVTDVFVCNSTVIGGQAFLNTYNTVVGHETYATSARDSDGHGTHTTTTAAGDAVSSAPIFGIDRGPISGVAPGAWVIEYKVCGAQGCFSSDSVAAVGQAIIDDVNVINYSISGGTQPYGDPVELAFLDAYDAGILVSASAGNSGPTAATTNHLGPWVLTVAASTQSRAFQSTLTVSDGAATADFVGTSLTEGVAAATPIVLAENIPGYDSKCSTPLAAGAATGKLVACLRGTVGRVQKGANVAAGGATGMILYNIPLADTESDNHFLPAIHLADGAAFLAFMADHPAASGSFTTGVKADGQGDVMAAFSSRGPGGQFLKPDITAPGVQVLAGNTPTPDDVASGPAGQYYQAIAGTSMSSPHIAGSAILLKALHFEWTPGEIKSALMTTATTNVVKEDLVTPADPFDFGAGRVDLTKAGGAAIVFDETTQRLFDLGQDPVTAIDANLPSINVPTMPGTVKVHRTATNVTNRNFVYAVTTTAPAGSRIIVSPSRGRIRPGQSQRFEITITSKAPSGQYFGQIRFSSQGSPAAHLPVAFFNRQGDVTLTQNCNPSSIPQRLTTTCSISAANHSAGDASVTINSKVSEGLDIVSAVGASSSGRRQVTTGPVTLAAPLDATPAIAAGDTPAGGYLDLGLFGVTPVPIGDEQNINFTVPAFTFGDKTYSEVGVDSNGYISVGGTSDASDISFIPQTLPDRARPNGVLAPYWTDMDGTGAPGVSVAALHDGPNAWVVVQWDTQVFGDHTAAGNRRMQVWIGVNGVQDISYAYDTNTIGKDAPPGAGLTVGAENVTGTGGAQITGPPAGSYVVTSTPGAPGGTLDVTLTVRGRDRGHRLLTSTMISDVVAGATIVATPIDVTRH